MNIALLTGRGGSVSLPDKNILPVLGRPMMSYPAIMAKEAKLIDDVYLSTDAQTHRARDDLEVDADDQPLGVHPRARRRGVQAHHQRRDLHP